MAAHYDDDFEADDDVPKASLGSTLPTTHVVGQTADGSQPLIGRDRQSNGVDFGASVAAATTVATENAAATQQHEQHEQQQQQQFVPASVPPLLQTTPATVNGAAASSSEQQQQPPLTATSDDKTTTNFSLSSFDPHKAFALSTNGNAGAADAQPAERKAVVTVVDPQERFASPKPRGARTAPLSFVCSKCGSVLFGGARLQVASVCLPDCDECKKLGFGEVFYSPPKINPEETRGQILKEKQMALLKQTIKAQERRQVAHAKAQLDAINEYIARSRRDKCDRVHKLKKPDGETSEAAAVGEQSSAAASADGESNKQQQPCKSKAKKMSAADQAVAGRPPVFSDSAAASSLPVPQFDSTTVAVSTVHGASLAAASGADLKAIVEAEAQRLGVTPAALLAIPGYIDMKGRRLGIKRVTHEGSSRFQLGFGFAGSPLHFAVLACRADLVAVLLDLGADPATSAGPSSIHASSSKALLAPTCIDMSRANKFDAVTSMLENALANTPSAKFDALCQKKLNEAKLRVRARREKLEERA